MVSKIILDTNSIKKKQIPGLKYENAHSKAREQTATKKSDAMIKKIKCLHDARKVESEEYCLKIL